MGGGGTSEGFVEAPGSGESSTNADAYDILPGPEAVTTTACTMACTPQSQWSRHQLTGHQIHEADATEIRTTT